MGKQERMNEKIEQEKNFGEEMYQETEKNLIAILENCINEKKRNITITRKTKILREEYSKRNDINKEKLKKSYGIYTVIIPK